jgi:hypothetical protein
MKEIKVFIRNNNGIDITDKEVRKEFPAIFNHNPAPHCSDRYQLYRSDEIIDRMTDKGMKLVELAQQASRGRNPSTQLHTMRFQPLETPPQFGVNDSVPEVVILNGHDGRNRFRAYAGIFRFICSNGMVVADTNLGEVVRRHFGQDNTFDKVAAIVSDLPDAILKMNGRILDWSALTLDEQEQVQLAMKLIEARGAPEWVTSEKVLEARRDIEQPVDGKRSMWTTFNVLQENLTNAEVVGSKLAGTRGPTPTLRPIHGAWRSVAANAALWSTADAYYNAQVEGLDEGEQEELAKARKAAYERNRRAVKAVQEAKEPVDA